MSPPRGLSWQRRSLYAFVTYLLAAGMYDSAAFGLWAPNSAGYAAASMTGAREIVSVAFVGCIAGALPFGLYQLRITPPPRWAILLLCSACFVAALLWMTIAFAARNTELTVVCLLYLRQAGEACLLMLLVAANCNAVLRAERGFADTKTSSSWRESNRVPLE